MNKKWLAVIIGAASAGLLGYGASRYLSSRKQGPKPEENESGKDSENDKRISQSECPSCGKPVKEYEFFCPYCGHTPEKQ
ncbi:hypothetical protein ACFLQK_00030 [bacterium]